MASEAAMAGGALRPAPGHVPGARIRAAVARDRAYQKAHRKIGLTLSEYAISLMASNPAMLLFMNREAGTVILMKLVQDVDEGLDAPRRHMFFADVAERFGISRTDVRITLRDAQEAGLVRMTGQSIVLCSRSSERSSDLSPIPWRGTNSCSVMREFAG
ncbi:MAG: hypothetical protein WA268_15035 [Xanthobacteraceae bacterium]